MTQSIGGIPSIQSYGSPQRATELPSDSIATDEGGSASHAVASDNFSAPGMGTGSASSLSLDDFGSDALDARFEGAGADELDAFMGPLPGLDEAPGSAGTVSQEDLQEQIITKLLDPLPLPSRSNGVTSFKEWDLQKRGQLIENIKNDPGLQEAFQNWDRLGYAAKMQAGVRISDMQALEYGFPAAPLRFDTDLVKDPSAFGYYSFRDRQISMSPYHLDDLPEFVNTIVHEQAHAFQDYATFDVEQAVALGKLDESHFMVQTAREWSRNFDNYIPPNKDPEGYRTQPVEAHAWATGDGIMNGVFSK